MTIYRLLHILRMNRESKRGLEMLEDMKETFKKVNPSFEESEVIWIIHHSAHLHYYLAFESNSSADDSEEISKEKQKECKNHQRRSADLFLSASSLLSKREQNSEQEFRLLFHIHGFLSFLFSSDLLDDPSLFFHHFSKVCLFLPFVSSLTFFSSCLRFCAPKKENGKD